MIHDGLLKKWVLGGSPWAGIPARLKEAVYTGKNAYAPTKHVGETMNTVFVRDKLKVRRGDSRRAVEKGSMGIPARVIVGWVPAQPVSLNGFKKPFSVFDALHTGLETHAPAGRCRSAGVSTAC